MPEEVAEYLQQFPDLQTARMHIESETQKIGEVIDLLEGAMLTPDLSLGEVICSVVWYLALAVGLFGTMLAVYYLGVPGADLPALIISGAE